MAVVVLMNKLMEAGAVTKDDAELTFTSRFAAYLIWTLGTSQLLDTTLGDWHNILEMFSPKLKSLSPDEITDAVLLFQYYLNQSETPESLTV